MKEERERGLKQMPDGRWQFSWCENGKYHRHIVPTKKEARAYLESMRTHVREARLLESGKEV